MIKKIAVVAIGDCGVNSIKNILSLSKEDMDTKLNLFACNTTREIEKIKNLEIKTLKFGENITFGLGCGGKISTGEKAASEFVEFIKELSNQYETIYTLSAAGGGTSGGTLIALSKAKSEIKASLNSIIFMPFYFEPNLLENAMTVKEAISNAFDNVYAIENDILNQIDDTNLSFEKGFLILDKKAYEILKNEISC